MTIWIWTFLLQLLFSSLLVVNSCNNCIQSFQSSGFNLKSGFSEASGFSAGFSAGHDLWFDFRILKKCLPTVVFFTLVNCKLPSANLVKIDCALYVSPTSQSVPHWSALITRCAIWRENRQCTHGVLFLAWVEAMTWPWLRPSSHHCALYGIVWYIGRSTLTIKIYAEVYRNLLIGSFVSQRKHESKWRLFSRLLPHVKDCHMHYTWLVQY